jgi:sec-independent protein translocase protein TatB
VFGISFTELVLILVVALVVLGPQRLPGMLRTVGLWIHKVRRISTEVRAQTGIDDLLRQEGFAGGLAELRALLRGDPHPLAHTADVIGSIEASDPYSGEPNLDGSRERPVEGPDAHGALPDDLVDEQAIRATLQASQQLKTAGASDNAIEGTAPDAEGTTPTKTESARVGPNVVDP